MDALWLFADFETNVPEPHDACLYTICAGLGHSLSTWLYWMLFGCSITKINYIIGNLWFARDVLILVVGVTFYKLKCLLYIILLGSQIVVDLRRYFYCTSNLMMEGGQSGRNIITVATFVSVCETSCTKYSDWFLDLTIVSKGLDSQNLRSSSKI